MTPVATDTPVTRNSKAAEIQARPAVHAGSIWRLVEADDGLVAEAADFASWSASEPRSRFVLMVESPALAIAKALAADDTLDPTDALSAWLQSAAQLRSQLRAMRASTTAFDAAELRALDAVATPACAIWAPNLPSLARQQTAPDPGGLLLTACAPLLSINPQALAVFEELHAACELLPVGGLLLSSPSTQDALVSLGQLQQLRRAKRSGSEAQAQRDESRAQALRLQQELDQVRESLTGLQEQSQTQRAEAEQVLHQLHQTQEELEQAWLSQQSAQAQAQERIAKAEQAAAAATQEQQSLKVRIATLEPLTEQLAALQRRLEEVEASRSASRDPSPLKPEASHELDMAAAALPLQRQLQESRAEAEQLLLQLHQTQEELERLWLEQQATKASHRTVVAGDPGNDSALHGHDPVHALQLRNLRDELARQYEQLRHYESLGVFRQPFAQASTGARSENDAAALSALPWFVTHMGPPCGDLQHRHIDFVFERSVSEGEANRQVTVRLLEHASRCGLGLLRMPGQAAPLGAWQTDGEEGSSSYMLMIPEDPHGAQALQHLPSSDWLLVNRLAQGMQNHLACLADESLIHWNGVAAKLNLLLMQMPARLRYDELLVEPAGQALPTGSLSVTLRNVVFGHLSVGQLNLQWQPGARFQAVDGPTAVALVRPSDAARLPPAFTAWPLQSQGGWAARWALPVGKGLTGQALRNRWAVLSPGDRELTLAVLDALPAAASRLKSLPAAAVSAHVALLEARAVFKQARSAVRAIQLRRGLRHLLRR